MSTKNKFEFDKVFEKLQQMKPKLPQEIAAIAQSSFVKNFNDESFFGKKWQQVQRRIEGTKAYKYPKTKKLSRRVKPILVGTGKLKREVNSSIRQATFDEVRLGVDLPYAAAQNEGTNGTASHTRRKTIKTKVRGSAGFVNGKWTKGKSKTVHLKGEEYKVSASNGGIPQREFMGNSLILENKIKDKIKKSISQIFK